MPQSARKSLLAQLPLQILAHPDDRSQAFIGWWLRMHQRRGSLAAAALKFVEWAEDGATAQRFVWEVCRWPQAFPSSWGFVCWMIDGNGMWIKPFPSQQAALAYFDQAPAVVMAPSRSDDGSPIQGVRLRRAS